MRSMQQVVSSVLVAAIVGACRRGDRAPVVEPPSSGSPIITPSHINVGVGGSQQVTVVVDGRTVRPTALSIDDSCIARVTPDGLVTGVGPGGTALRLKISMSGQTYGTGVPVTVGGLGPVRLTIQSITTGSPPAAVDLTAVRGTVTVTANVDPRSYSSVELRLSGRSLGTQPVTSDSTSSLMQALSFTVNTAARDVSGAPLFPNGAQSLMLAGTERHLVFACSTASGIDTVQQQITLANP